VTARASRAALNMLGDGFVEKIDDSTLLASAKSKVDASQGRIHGEAIQVPVLEAPGQTRAVPVSFVSIFCKSRPPLRRHVHQYPPWLGAGVVVFWLTLPTITG
jgi:hypothetical protein